jgi:hypothetical protein
VLGINANVISSNQGTVVITIVGTGFDVNNQGGLTFSFLPTLPKGAIAGQGVLSDNLAFLQINTNASGLAANGPYALTIRMTNRNSATTTLPTTLTVLPA